MKLRFDVSLKNSKNRKNYSDEVTYSFGAAHQPYGTTEGWAFIFKR
jgi:hypothetical protein